MSNPTFLGFDHLLETISAKHSKLEFNQILEEGEYIIGDETLIGPIEFSKSYEANMIEGRKKLDKLEWGQCRNEDISESEFYVHFTGYLTHKSEEFIHRCKQKITVDTNNIISKNEHISNPLEQERLNNYCKTVGLK